MIWVPIDLKDPALCSNYDYVYFESENQSPFLQCLSFDISKTIRCYHIYVTILYLIIFPTLT